MHTREITIDTLLNGLLMHVLASVRGKARYKLKVWEGSFSANVVPRAYAVLLTCYLAPNQTKTIADLVQAIGIPSHAMYRAMAQLEKTNLLTRVQNPADGRYPLVKFTARGTRCMESLRTEAAQQIAQSSSRATGHIEDAVDTLILRVLVEH